VTPQERREQRLRLLDDHIGEALRRSEADGELKRAASYGRPLPEDAGWQQTPPELRLPFKILKDAGIVPPEVAVMREIADLQRRLHDETLDATSRRTLEQAVADKRQHLALRLERLRLNASL
jgi:hypothetical protein